LLELFKITKAAITPGTQPHNVKINTIKTEPHPLSQTERGGKIIERITRQKLKKNILNIISKYINKMMIQYQS
jgi:hypothetical protein